MYKYKKHVKHETLMKCKLLLLVGMVSAALLLLHRITCVTENADEVVVEYEWIERPFESVHTDYVGGQLTTRNDVDGHEIRGCVDCVGTTSPQQPVPGTHADYCPINYNITAVCDVALTTLPCSIRESNKPTSPATVHINGSLVYSWTEYKIKSTKLFVFNKTCQIGDARTFNGAYAVDEIKAFLRTLPRGTHLAWVIVSPHTSLWRTLLYYGVPQTVLDKTHKKPSILTFTSRIGYKKQTVAIETHELGQTITMTKSISYGVTFDMNTTRITYDTLVGEHWHSSGSSVRPQTDGPRSPVECTPRWHLAIIIPFRKRESHLWVFIRNMERFLALQNINFTIFIVEQAEPEMFNRAALMNVGYLEAKRMALFDCYVFHDVDLIPEDLTNIYDCGDKPRHLVVSRSSADYAVQNDQEYEYFGGAVIMTPAQIERINGFPNLFFGWGGEDDDILARIRTTGQDVLRYSPDIATYYSLPHGVEKGNPHMERKIGQVLEYAKDHYMDDGLNTVNYTLLSVTYHKLYTNITVRIPGPSSEVDIENKYNDNYMSLEPMIRLLVSYYNSYMADHGVAKALWADRLIALLKRHILPKDFDELAQNATIKTLDLP